MQEAVKQKPFLIDTASEPAGEPDLALYLDDIGRILWKGRQ